MNGQKQYKITVAEAATKGAKLADGGATAWSWCVVRIDTETGAAMTAAQIITAAAANAADKDAARRVKEMSMAFGGVYTRRSAAVVAAALAVDMLGEEYYLDNRLDLDKARPIEGWYMRDAAARRDASRARRLERMTPEQRAAAELRESIREVRARAAAEIAALRGTFKGELIVK